MAGTVPTTPQEIEDLVKRHGEQWRAEIVAACRWLDQSEAEMQRAGLKLRRTSRVGYIKGLLAKATKSVCVLLLVAASGCATTRYTLRHVEPVGPVQVEIWHDKRTQSCERRVYLDGGYYRTVVPCP